MQIDWDKLKQRQLEDKKLFYLIVAGSRGFTEDGSMSYLDESSEDGYSIVDNYAIFSMMLDKILKPIKEKYEGIVIVEGGANGPDKMAKRYAESRGYRVKEFLADWEGQGRSAGMKRNRTMYLHVEMRPNRAAILFWDGESRGTLNNFLCAYDFRVKVLCYHYLEKRWLTQDEIHDIQVELDREQQRYW